MTGIYARTAATYAALAGKPPTRAAAVPGAPYARADELLADLRIVADSLGAPGSVLRAGRLENLCAAVACFGFHLTTLDLRQNADVHARADLAGALRWAQDLGENPARALAIEDRKSVV